MEGDGMIEGKKANSLYTNKKIKGKRGIVYGTMPLGTAYYAVLYFPVARNIALPKKTNINPTIMAVGFGNNVAPSIIANTPPDAHIPDTVLGNVIIIPCSPACIFGILSSIFYFQYSIYLYSVSVYPIRQMFHKTHTEANLGTSHSFFYFKNYILILLSPPPHFNDCGIVNCKKVQETSIRMADRLNIYTLRVSFNGYNKLALFYKLNVVREIGEYSKIESFFQPINFLGILPLNNFLEVIP